jgi:hypothetical protein
LIDWQIDRFIYLFIDSPLTWHVLISIGGPLRGCFRLVAPLEKAADASRAFEEVPALPIQTVIPYITEVNFTRSVAQ